MRERSLAKAVKAVLTRNPLPNFKTLNGYFVREGDSFPFCGFPEPWICPITKCLMPGFSNIL